MTADPRPSGLVRGGLLGAGGMGLVHAATEVDLDRTVAVKSLRQGLATAAHREALLAEARITSAVSHPNVVPIHDVRIAADGSANVVLKRIEGRPWDELLRDPVAVLREHGQPHPLDFHIGVLAQVCAAVHAAHSRDIVHRDIKPSNVIISPHGGAILLDWGLAATLDPDADARLPRISATSDGAGTPQYMAPEMVSPRYGEVGPWTDVYLLGGMLFQILWGRPPHDGGTPWAMLLESCRNGVEVPNDGPTELVALCRRCLERQPERRLQDAESVRRALLTWRSHRASVGLSDEGRAQQALMEALLDAPGESPPAMRVHGLFGAAVSAYHRAIEAWPNNQTARDGLTQTVRRVVEHSLDADEATVARVALGYLEHPPQDLVDRVETGQQRSSSLAQRQAHWRAAGRGHLNEITGTPTRAILLTSGGVMVSITAATALIWSLFAPIGPTILLVASIAGLGTVLGAVGAVATRPLGGLDTRIAAHLVFFGVARVLTLATATVWHGSGAQAAALELAVTVVLLIVQSLAFRRRLWPVALTAAVSSVCCLIFPTAAALFLGMAYAGVVSALLSADLSTRRQALHR